MFNLTGKARARYQYELVVMMMRLERIQAKQVRQTLNSQFLQVARAYEQGIDDFDYIINGFKPRITKEFKNHMIRTGTIFSQNTFKRLKGKSASNDFWYQFNTWMNAHMVSKITNVTNTTKKTITRIIQKATGEGLSRKEIASSIRKKGGILNPIRSRMIAATETHTAAVKAVDETVSTTRIDFEREWISTMDERTRFDHTKAGGGDGQTQPMGSEFTIGGEGLMFPGDPSGSAGNIINCRCVLGYLT